MGSGKSEAMKIQLRLLNRFRHVDVDGDRTTYFTSCPYLQLRIVSPEHGWMFGDGSTEIRDICLAWLFWSVRLRFTLKA